MKWYNGTGIQNMKMHNNMTEAELWVLYHRKIRVYNELVDEIRQILLEIGERKKEDCKDEDNQTSD